MTDAAIIKATFSEWRMVKGRKVLQIICEVPLEAQRQVFEALGAPMPDAETWVAIARLRPEAVQQPEPEQLEPPRRPASMAQLAGILCNEGAFQQFIKVKNAAEAAEYVRAHCRVSSRANIDGNPDATEAFKTLKGEYELWLRCEAA